MATDATVRITAQNDTAKAFREIIASGNEAGEALRHTFETAFVGISVASFAENIGSAIEYADAVGKAGEKSGMAAAEFSQLAYAAQQSDIDLGSLETGVKKMQVSIAGGSDAFARLGVNLDALKRLSPDKQFEVLADAIARVQDPAERTKAAVDLFGKAGADLLPLLNQGAQGIEKLREEADALGLTLDEGTKKEIEAADEAIKKFHGSTQAFWRFLATEFGPGYAQILDGIRGVTGEMTVQEATQNRLVALMSQRDQMFEMMSHRKLDLGELDNLNRINSEILALQKSLEAMASKGANVSEAVLGKPADNKAAVEAVTAEWEALYNKISGFTAKFHADQAKAAQAAADKEKQRIDAEQQATMTEVEKKDQAWTEFYQQLNDLRAKNAINEQQYAQRSAEFQANWLDEAVVTVKKLPIEHHKAMDEMTEYGKRASQNMQDAMATFLYDPFHAGLRGMLGDFIDTMRKMVAQAAAANLAKAMFGADGGSGWFGKIFGAILGSAGGGSSLTSGVSSFVGNDAYAGQYATGGSFTVGGTGGTDSQPVSFMATPGETVSIARPDRGQGGGSSPVNITTHIDARGADPSLISRLPEILRRNNEMVESNIIQNIRRKKYPI